MLRRAASMDSGGYRWRPEEVGACTESLGSESGDVVGFDVADSQLVVVPEAAAAAAVAGDRDAEGGAGRVEDQRMSPEKRRRRLPPAMPRAAEAFMRAERRGGRLILTEVVRAERRDVFRASRADGCLRLRFADDVAEEQEEEDTPEQMPPATAPEAESVASGGVVVVGAGGGCCHGRGFSCQVAPGAGRCIGIRATVMGI